MEPLLVADIAELRGRLLGKGEPGRLYAQVREVVKHPEMEYPLWRFLVQMVEPAFGPTSAIAKLLLDLAGRGGWRDRYMLDVHTWIASASLGRLAIYLDWAIHLGALPEREVQQLASEMIGVAETAVRPVLETRVARDLEPGQTVWLPNQGAALLFGCAAVGFVLGYRRGSDPRARRLADESLETLARFVGHLRPDGYDGEGPTYQLGVEAPALALTCAILEQATGENLFDRRFEPSGVSLRKWFETTCLLLLSPLGLTRPFDDYGYGRPGSLIAFAYAAGRSRDGRFMAPVREHCLWDAHHALWENDDRALSLLFWPETAPGGTGAPGGAGGRSAVLPATLAVLRTGGSAPVEVLLTWKPCEPLPHTHAHTDPGNVAIECGGIPLALDGRPPMVRIGGVGSPYHRLLAGANTDYFIPYRFGEADVRDQGAVALAPHNTILIDGVMEIPLGRPAGGKLVAWEETDELTRCVVELAEPYRCRFDLRSFVREVIAYRDGRCVIRDRLQADSPHEFTWRMHVRPEVEPRPDGWDVRTRDGVDMAVRVTLGADLETDRIEAFPGAFEGHCVRLQMHARGREAAFEASLHCSDRCRELVDVTDGWAFRADQRLEGFEKGWTTGSFEPAGVVSLSLLPSIAGYPDCAGRAMWLVRELPEIRQASPAGRWSNAADDPPVCLEMRPPNTPFRLWLGGRPIPVRHGSWSELLPLRIELGRPSEVFGRRLVLFTADLPSTRPPAPLRLIQIAEVQPGR